MDTLRLNVFARQGEIFLLGLDSRSSKDWLQLKGSFLFNLRQEKKARLETWTETDGGPCLRRGGGGGVAALFFPPCLFFLTFACLLCVSVP